MSSARHRTYTIEEYVRLERYSNVRHEFVDGQVYAMAGGSPEHSAYAANLIAILASQLRDRPCRVHTSDARIRVQASGLDTYPDVSVVCGHAERDRDDSDAIVNPIVLVEVLRPSTEEYDRGEKLENYKLIPALREVVFVAHDARRVDILSRSNDGLWSLRSALAGDSLRLESIGCEIAVDEVYRDPLAS